MNEALAIEVELGEEAKRFIDSDIGRLILGLAKQEADAAKEDLVSVDPNDTKKIRDLQAKAWRADSFERWLYEIVKDGEESLNVFIQQQKDDN